MSAGPCCLWNMYKNPSLPLPSFWCLADNPWHCLAYSYNTATCLCPHGVSTPVSGPVFLLFTQEHQAYWIMAHSSDLILTWLQQQRPTFPIRPHSQVPGVNSLTCLFWGTQLNLQHSLRLENWYHWVKYIWMCSSKSDYYAFYNEMVITDGIP